MSVSEMPFPMKKKNHFRKLINQSLHSSNSGKSKKLEKVIEAYRKAYKRTSVLPLTNIRTLGLSGVPFYAWCLKGFDLSNLKRTEYEKLNDFEFKGASYYERRHVGQYFQMPEFTKMLLKTTQYDYILYAIVSVMLSWNNDSLNSFAKEYGATNMIASLIKERNIEDGRFIYYLKPDVILKNLKLDQETIENEVDPFYRNTPHDELIAMIKTHRIPIMLSAIKIIKIWFLNDDPVELQRLNSLNIVPKMRSNFNWLDTLSHSFVDHLKQVYKWVLEDSFDVEKIKLLEEHKILPYKLENICNNLESKRGSSKFKFITGQACCGKTTLLNKFRKNGWKIYSRGALGSFSGKAHDAATIANLHAALQYKLTQPDVIGDRGSIDNPLWTFIMQACNPEKRDNVVIDLLNFINSTFNEPSIAEYISQKGVIFIDPYPKLNSERMLQRCTDGDANRGRIPAYNPIQFISYYAVARLFGWKCYSVPYTVDRIFDPKSYDNIAEELTKFFGSPNPTNESLVYYNKPKNEFCIDSDYPKSIGIYK